MDLYLLDESRTPIYIIDDYVSLVWTERFQEPGEFELRLKPTRYSFNDFVKDRFLVKSDSNDVMIIESREISNDFDEEGKFLDIKGRSVSSILGRRIDMSHCLEIICNGTYTYTGDVINVMNDIVNKNLINPIVQMTDYEHLRQVGEDDIENEFQRLTFYDKSAPNRKISELVLGPSSPSGKSISFEVSEVGISVLDILKKICEEYEAGFKVTLNPKTKKFEFVSYYGMDRSLEQRKNTPLYFSEEMGNILYVNYYEDAIDYKNTVYTFGSSGPANFSQYLTYGATQNISMARNVFPGFCDVSLNVGSGHIQLNPDGSDYQDSPISGLARREGYVSSEASLDNPPTKTTVDAETGEETDSTEINGAQWAVLFCPSYVSRIWSDGVEYLRSPDVKYVKDANGEIDVNVFYHFGIDYFLGDIVEYDTGYELNSKALVDEVVYSYDSDGIIVTPNFRDIDQEDE